MARRRKRKFRSITKSAINLWYKCPRHFYYKYICNTAKPTQKIISWRMILGSYLHQFIARYLNRPSTTPPFYFKNLFTACDRWEKYFSGGVTNQVSKYYKGEEGMWNLDNCIKKHNSFGRAAVSNYWKTFINYPPPLEVEKHLSIDISGIAPGFKLVGTLDEIRFMIKRSKIIELYPNTSFSYYPIVVDIKTGGTKQYIGPSNGRFEPEEISRKLYPLRADPQGIIYMVLFNKVYRRQLQTRVSPSGLLHLGPVSFGIHNIMSRETLVISYEEEYWLELQNTIVAIWNAVQSGEMGDFPIKADVYNCLHCEYFHHCAHINNQVGIISHKKRYTADDEDTVVVEYNEAVVPKGDVYKQKKLFKLPRKVALPPKIKPIPEGIQRVIKVE